MAEYEVKINGEVVWSSGVESYMIGEVSIVSPRGEVTLYRPENTETVLDLNIQIRTEEDALTNLEVIDIETQKAQGEAIMEKEAEEAAAKEEAEEEVEESEDGDSENKEDEEASNEEEGTEEDSEENSEEE